MASDSLLSSSSSCVCRGIAIISPAAAADAVQDAGTAGAATDADADAEDDGKEDDEGDNKPGPPEGATLSIKRGDSLLLVTVRDGLHALVICHTLPPVDLAYHVVEVSLHLI